MTRPPPTSPLFPYTTLFRSGASAKIGLCPGAEYGPAKRWLPERFAGVANAVSNQDRKSTRLNSSHRCISYAVFCLKKKNTDSKTFEKGNPLLRLIICKIYKS